MKKALFLLILLLAALVLAGCAADDATYPEADGNYQRDPLSLETPEPEVVPDYQVALPEDYDPASEEDEGTYDLVGVYYDENGRQIYAGATPIPLDPVDLPTATPRPKLAFTYTEISVNGLTFEYPQGWMVDTPDASTIVLTDPNTYDNVNATMTIRFESVSNSYSMNDVKAKVNEMLQEIGQYNYTSWQTYQADSRTLLGKDGYYNNYRGEYYDGTIIRGRVMVALLDNHQIITLHMSCPGWYNDSYMNVVGHFRDTAKLN